MRQNYKRLLAALVLMSATQTSSVVQAEGIRLVGPSGEVQSSPSYAEEIERALPTPPENTQPSRFFGPTGENQTLWSIASELRPSRNVSVQQTLLAIYRINPQAFDNQNIHELIPGSRLRVPSLEQVRSATTEQAVAIMKAHELRLKQPKPEKPAPVKQIEVKPKPVAEPTAPKPPVVTPPKPEPVKPVETTANVPPVSTSPQGEKQVSELKDKLQGSQSELESLEEKNHRLRLMLSQVQSEVETLKSELNDEERIRSEVEKLLAEERQRVAEQQRMQPSTMDKILSNGWLVGLAALIPGALLALLVVMLLGRRSKSKEEEAAQQQTQDIDPLAAPIGLAAADQLDDELSLDDDLFGDDDSEPLLEQDEKAELEEDVFANLDDEELDFNLEGDDGEDPFAGIGDDGDLDVGFDEFDSSTSGIQVNGDEKALGLEEMERALDEVTPELEVLDEDETGFDLSDDDNAISDDEFAKLLADDEPSEDLSSGSVDQAMLDDLFAELGDDDLDLDVEDTKPGPQVSDEDFSAGEASDDDIDKLLAQYDQPAEETSSELDPLDELESLAGLTDDTDIDENSTELLDELIDFDEDETEEEFDPLNELEALSDFEAEEVIEELDENSVDLLDELLQDDDDEPVLEDEITTELDPFDDLIREDEVVTADESQLDDDLVADFGFEEIEPQTEQNKALEPEEEKPLTAQVEEDASELEFESGLDIDALLSEAQQQPVAPEPTESLQEESVPFNSNDFLGDLEEMSPEHDPLMTELDELFESDNSVLEETEQESADFAAELDALLEGKDGFAEELENSSVKENLMPSAEELPSENGEYQPRDEQTEPEITSKEEEPAFTPTPNTVENEFGVPQEEDWLLDDVESEAENKLEQEPVAATSTDVDEDEFNFDELELPEFDEEDALASMADEPELPEAEVQAAAPTVDAEEDFNFDELELPEFDEEDALASMADEPELPEAEVQAAAPTAEAEEEFNFDELELPEFDEEDALASMAGEPELPEAELQTAEPTADEEEEFNFDELELPEFDEEDALASMAAEPELPEAEVQTAEPTADAEEEFNFDDLELPEFDEEDALASMTAEPELPEAEVQTAEPTADAEEEFNFDELELPEFDEEDALASMAAEPELPESEVQAAAPTAEAEEEFNFDELELPEFDEEDALASMADEPELPESEREAAAPAAEAEEEFNFDDTELPEFSEEDAIAAMAEASSSSESEVAPKPILQADNDHDALFEVFAQNSFDQEEAQTTSIESPSELDDFDESTMANLLADEPSAEAFDGKLDSDTIASAGMDFETMLDVGDDWDGFKPASDMPEPSVTEEVPEDQQEVWSSSEALTQPEIAQENWAEQEDLDDFDPKKNQFMTIDELMAQVDKEGGEFEEQELMLDVGLNEFPDVIGDIGDVDVDTNAEAAGKLDLAKIYLEMNDPQGAIKLLEEAIVYGEDDIRREAKNLIDTINGR
ncbi:FimV/HubP family polar landmark protein [Vibrio parahaemolyticus]|uniref:FimV/HubP family polar landmark protein n=1 Tax=Vibrio parahaemolyticus TaxID=670 RepID=UPI001A904180|nr:FimV/HubP family polar landmark protein [Vibrio parahaemolyticus]MBO0165919.1 AAA family ATPase [Vibrio parahaemolyticus]MDF4751954.1 FimV/HubP family polar landmark protein [Vibrio parahaemolyticus]MDF4778184.1 FimV/HubP family polar landmark protein [Vibrio parahaemolyticus]MDF4783453.1 FimV/HubP family polar landmark protein [Vibrio parahaemolyticus]MDF4823919.1 FimV/HubP family polar landmark protein [Vibrio parahaemolyticus]